MYASQQSVSGGSTPVPSINQGFGAPAAPSGNFGSTGNVSTLEIGALSTGTLIFIIFLYFYIVE